jgi:hypothetical protein
LCVCVCVCMYTFDCVCVYIHRMCDEGDDRSVTILNRQVLQLGSSYPFVGDVGYYSLMSCHYISSRTNPKNSDFTTLAAEDTKNFTRKVSGPIIVRGISRASTKDIAINRFMKDHLSHLGPVTGRTTDCPFGTRHCHFVSWKIFGKTILDDALSAVYSQNKEVYTDDDFLLGADFPQEEGWCVCTHSLEEPSIPQNAPRETQVQAALSMHATHCLRKRLVHGKNPSPRVESIWSSGKTLQQDRTSLSPDQWVQQHPFFSRVRYESNGTILLTKHETAKLGKEHSKIYKQIKDGKPQPEAFEEFSQFLKNNTEETYRRLIESKLDTGEMAFCNAWTLSEMLKFHVAPPTTRPHIQTAHVPLSQDLIDFGIALPKSMYLVTNSKSPVDREVVLCVSLKEERMAQYITSVMGKFKFTSKKTKQGSVIAVLQGHEAINQFIDSLVKALGVPYTGLIPSCEPRLDAVEFQFWITPEKIES